MLTLCCPGCSALTTSLHRLRVATLTMVQAPWVSIPGCRTPIVGATRNATPIVCLMAAMSTARLANTESDPAGNDRHQQDQTTERQRSGVYPERKKGATHEPEP